MKKLLAIAIFAFCALGCRDSDSDVLVDARSRLHLFSAVLETYKMDSQAENLPPSEWFPQSLDVLVEQNYINIKDFEYMKSDYKLVYIHPNKPSENPVVLTIENSRIFGELKADSTYTTRMPPPFVRR